jgi:hypothetical protein
MGDLTPLSATDVSVVDYVGSGVFGERARISQRAHLPTFAMRQRKTLVHES